MPNALSVVRRLGVGLLSALLPANCYVCGALAGRAMVCPRCRAEFPLLPAELCPVCALASPAGAICGACRRAPPPYAASLALYPYAFPIRELIHALKFDANFGVLGLFSEELAQAVLRCGADCVVPVPVHRRRLAERGFNQAVLIARPVAKSLGVPLLLDAVVKDRVSVPQAGLTREARRANVRGAFRAVRRFDGARVLVVDDVMTSGATLTEVALALRAAGALSVENLVLARTLRD